jgi:uncharacterized protein HemX
VSKVEEKVQAIEGITPGMLWTTLIVVVGLMALYVLFGKARDVFRNEKQKKKEQTELQGQDITDRIANKVIEKLEPKLNEKFAEIDRKLESDKQTLELHTSQLNAQRDRVDRLDNDTRALLHGVSALLNHIATGNNVDKVKKTNAAMSNYLIDRKYDEEDWKV